MLCNSKLYDAIINKTTKDSQALNKWIRSIVFVNTCYKLVLINIMRNIKMRVLRYLERYTYRCRINPPNEEAYCESGQFLCKAKRLVDCLAKCCANRFR